MQTVIVTGATGVFGAKIVRHLSSEREVLALFHQDENGARQLQNETGCRIMRCDVSKENDVEQVFAAAGSVFAVIHAAGVARDALLLRQNPSDWEETLRVNLDGAFLVARAALQKMKNGGRLIFFASKSGMDGGRGQAAYAASKVGVIALMQCAAREGGERGITANAICPGFVPSRMNRDLSEETRQGYLRQSVLNEYGTPQSAVEVVQWLLSESGHEVSGQVISCHSRI